MSGLRLAVIPARGGSKRLPRKNLLPLGGRPMIAYTIEAAIASRLFDAVAVSTDDVEIAGVARDLGATVVERSGPLADDHTPVSTVTLAAIEAVEATGTGVEVVAQLLPNCPLRTAEDVASSFQSFAPEGGLQISVTRYGWLNPWWALSLDDAATVTERFPEAWRERSQDLPPLYCPTGAIWWAEVAALRRAGTFHGPGRRGHELPWQRAVDIDDADDLALAKALMALGTAG